MKVCVDKSAWDWTVQGWVVDAWKIALKRLCVAPERFVALFESAVFRFHDGTRVQQDGKGIMKSGCNK